MTLGSYLTSVFCTICNAEIRTEGRRKNQKSKMLCKEQATARIKENLWWLLFTDTRGTDINRTPDAQHPQKKSTGTETWQKKSQACKYEPDLPGVIGPAVSRQIPFNLLWRFRNHRPHSWPVLATKGPEIYFLEMKLSHVISSPTAARSYLTLSSAWDL